MRYAVHYSENGDFANLRKVFLYVNKVCTICLLLPCQSPTNRKRGNEAGPTDSWSAVARPAARKRCNDAAKRDERSSLSSLRIAICSKKYIEFLEIFLGRFQPAGRPTTLHTLP